MKNSYFPKIAINRLNLKIFSVIKSKNFSKAWCHVFTKSGAIVSSTDLQDLVSQ